MGDAEREYLPHSSRCFICGDENGCGVRTRFFVQGDALREESMGWAATVFGGRHPMYLTGELTVKYLSPVSVGEEIEIASRLVEDSGRIAYSTGELVCGGKVCVKASGKF